MDEEVINYKLIEGYSVTDLERNVNAFMDKDRNQYKFTCKSAPQMWGHSVYVQAVVRI